MIIPNSIIKRLRKITAQQGRLEGVLNDLFDYKWSWEVASKEVVQCKTQTYVVVLGRLTIPGLATKEAYGVKAVDGDNAYEIIQAAVEQSFINTCALLGITEATTIEVEPESEEEPEEEYKDFTEGQIQAMKDLKGDYHIETNDELSAFVRQWRPRYEDATNLHGGNVDSFIAWFEQNIAKLKEDLL